MKLAMSAAVAVAASTIGLTAGLAVNAGASTVTPAHHTVQRELPGWLGYTFQPGSHRKCVVIVNTTPRGDTSVLMCRNGVVEPS